MTYCIPCPNCGTPLTLKYDYIISINCRKCHSVCSAESWLYPTVEKFLIYWYDRYPLSVVITYDEVAV